MIKVNCLKKIYKGNDSDVTACDDINLNFSDAGLYMILGKSGCGKTTLLNVLSGIQDYDEGSIFVGDKDITNYTEREMDDYRNLDIGIIFQDYNLISDISVYDNLKLVLSIQKTNIPYTEEMISEKISKTLKLVGLTGYESRKIFELSGGEQQRVAIARVIIKQPKIIFADEPTGNLDSYTSNVIFELLKTISKKYIVVVVTHDREAAYRYGDNIINMLDGRVVSVDKEIYDDRKYLYSFSIENHGDIKHYNNLNGNELSDVIKRIFTMQSSVAISNIRRVERKEDSLENDMEEYDSNSEKKSSKLTMFYRIKLATMFLKKKRLRLCMTTLIIAISITFLYATLYSSMYNDQEIMNAYLQESDVKYLPIYMNGRYVDIFLQEYDTSYSIGQKFETTVKNVFLEECDLIEIKQENEIYVVDTEDNYQPMHDVTVFFLQEEYDVVDIYEGNGIENEEDIVITDYIASELCVEVGDNIIYEDTVFNVSGIIKTDYVEYEYKRKRFYGYDGEYLDYYTKFKYCRIYLHENVLEKKEMKTRFLRVKLSDFTSSDKELTYIDSQLMYGSVESVSSNETIIGRLPKDENEVLVSLNFAIEHSVYNDGKISDEMYSFKDMYRKLYNDYYSQYLNLYDYYPNGIKVVGIVESDTSLYDIFVHENVWKSICKDFYMHYYPELIIDLEGADCERIINLLCENDIYIDEPGIHRIYEFTEILDEMKMFLYLLLFLSIILNVIMLITFINISIHENNRNIGILRALGVTKKDTGSIFKIEFLFINIFAFLIGIIFTLICTKLANDTYAKSLNENVFDIVCMDNKVLVIVLIIEVAINIIAFYIPFTKLNRKKTIDIMKNR